MFDRIVLVLSSAVLLLAIVLRLLLAVLILLLSVARVIASIGAVLAFGRERGKSQSPTSDEVSESGQEDLHAN